MRIVGWIPASVNKLTTRDHWAVKRRIKGVDRDTVHAAAILSQIPVANDRRSVHCHVVYPQGQRRFDRDNLRKSLLDALVSCAAIKNDSPKWLISDTITDSRGDGDIPVTYITVSEA